MRNDYVELALKIATESHKGQRDKAGVDYIEHPKKVASFVNSDEEKAAAYLHDVLEDTDLTAGILLSKGIPKVVVDAVIILTKNNSISYFDYLEQVKRNPISRTVKLADLKHNSDLKRIRKPTAKDYERVRKYQKAIAYL